MNTHHKTPRIYTDQPLSVDSEIALADEHTHYLKNVLRLSEGAPLRIFNGFSGEYLAEISRLYKFETKLKITLQIRSQTESPTGDVHLLFAPVKKQRLDILIEKAVELGATHLHPVMTEHTENRHIKEERIKTQIIEAAEQCERLDIPLLSPIKPLKEKIAHWQDTDNIYWAAERQGQTQPLSTTKPPAAFLIGPEGGFSPSEIAFLSQEEIITPVSLGPRILRAETAAFYCLAKIT